MGVVTTDRVARYAELVSRETQTLEELGQRIADGEGLPAICKVWDVPYGRVLGWLMADAKRYAVYERALEVAAHALVSEVVGIADAAEDVPKARLQTDVRFRAASFHAREKYGEQHDAGKPMPAVQINIGVRAGPVAPVIEAEDAGDI